MYGDWSDDDRTSRTDNMEQINEAMNELRGFKPYLSSRLQYIRDSNRSLELQDDLTDIEFYMSVIASSDADLVHGLEGLKGFVRKLHEMEYKKRVPKGFKFKKEDVKCENSSGASNVDDNSSQEGSELGEAVGDRKQRLKKVKEYQDYRITENIKSLREPEAGSAEPEPAWLTFQKAKDRNKSGNEAPPSASGVTPSSTEQQRISQPVSTPDWSQDNTNDLMDDNQAPPSASGVTPSLTEQQHISQPVTTPDWLQENTNDRVDPLVVAGLEGICERREKKVDVKVTPILKDNNLRQNPVFRPPQPFGPSQAQFQQPPVPPAPVPYFQDQQATAPCFQTPAPYYQRPQTPAPYYQRFQTPAPYVQGSQTPASYTQVATPYFQAPAPCPPIINQPLTTTPSWMIVEPNSSYQPQPTSYDYSRSAPSGAIMRQPPLASTYVAGLGHVIITPPLQSNPPPSPQPRMNFQQSEYQVPRDVRPNPFYKPRHQNQPVVKSPNNHQYNHPSIDLHADQRQGSRFNGCYPPTPAPTASTYPADNDSPDCDNEDNESTMSYGSYKKAQMQKKQVRFQRNAATSHPPRNRRYFHNQDQAQTKRDGGSKTNQQQQTPRSNINRRSTVKQILEKGQQKMYKLGQHEKIAEEVEEEDLRPPSVRSPQQSDSYSSPSESESPEPEENKGIAVLKLALSKIKTKKELMQLRKDDSALRALWQKNPPTKQAKKNVKAKEDVPPVKKGKKPQQNKNKETVSGTSKESPSKGLNEFSSESESGSVVSSMSTRSATRKLANQEKCSDSEISSPGTSRSKLPRNMAVKSGSGSKGKGSDSNYSNMAKKSPPPKQIRKRVVQPLDFESDNDQDEGNAASTSANTSTSAEDTSCEMAKPVEQAVKRKPSSALVQECIAELMIEQNQKKKKTTEAGPKNWHKKKIVNEKGGQLIRQNDILVNRRLNKIDLGFEYAEFGDGGVKQEVKIETETGDGNEEMEEGDYLENFDGNQMAVPECEIISEISEVSVGEMPENVVEVMMETSDCENNGEDEDDELAILEPHEDQTKTLSNAENGELETLEKPENSGIPKDEEGSRTET